MLMLVVHCFLPNSIESGGNIDSLKDVDPRNTYAPG